MVTTARLPAASSVTVTPAPVKFNAARCGSVMPSSWMMV